MVVAENGSSDLPRPSPLLPSAPRRGRRIRRSPPLNLFSKLEDDLLVEILIRLPNPRSSCRCKAVSKRWRSLLSDPSFNCRFISHHQSKYQPTALFLSAHEPESVLSFLPVPDKARPYLRAFDCFKDLLLCGFVGEMAYKADGSVAEKINNSEWERSYLVCNPFTKQWIALPLAPEKPPGCVLLAAGLFCQPRSNNHNEPEPAFFYSEYRFRVGCICQFGVRLVLQLFCGELGDWSQMYYNDSIRDPSFNAVTLNGKFLWFHVPVMQGRGREIIAFEAFRPYATLASIGAPPPLLKTLSNFSVSQGAFHLIVFEVEGKRHGKKNAITVWRLDEDSDTWNLQYKVVLKTIQSSLWGGYELKNCSVVDLHPEKPEIIYFKYLDNCVFSCNFKTGKGEPELFYAIKPGIYEPQWRAFMPRVTCWPTPIPRYEELRGMYNGSYDCWVQNSSTTTLPSAIEENQPLVEQSGHRRKGKRSAAASPSKRCVRRKQKVVKGALYPKSGKSKLSSVIS